ncbi:MAG: type II toxin-antitoxin system HicB family antitoxin [Nanoarchaeota archaeon]
MRKYMEKATYTVVLHQEEDMFIAECPEIGTVSQGRTIEKAIENLKEATELYLEEFPVEEKKRPMITFFDVITHASLKKVIG